MVGEGTLIKDYDTSIKNPKPFSYIF